MNSLWQSAAKIVRAKVGVPANAMRRSVTFAGELTKFFVDAVAFQAGQVIDE